MRNAGGTARQQIPAATKLQILKEGRQANGPITQVCEHHTISAAQFCDWELIAGQPRPHGITAMGSNAYGYDANGNMTYRLKTTRPVTSTSSST